jgi:hypothetical protein
MSAWFPPLRAKVMLACWAAVAIAGAAPVLYLAGLLAWQVVGLLQRGSWVPLPASLLLTEHSFAFLPALGWAWLMSPDSLLPVHSALMWVLGRVHAGAIFGVIGLVLIGLGVLGVLRHYAALRVQRQRAEDRQRRVHDYRNDRNDYGHLAAFDGRQEPFISEPRKSRVAAGGAR